MALTFSLVDTWDDGKRVHVSLYRRSIGELFGPAATRSNPLAISRHRRDAGPDSRHRVDGRPRGLRLQFFRSRLGVEQRQGENLFAQGASMPARFPS